MPTHQELDEKSLRLHQLVASKVRAHPELLERAQTTLKHWRATASPRTFSYLDEWQRWLDMDMDTCLRLALDTSEHATAMRQSSPLACLLSNTERFAFLKSWRESHPQPRTPHAPH